MKYLFGNPYCSGGRGHNHSKLIEADTVELAIYKFAYSVNDIYAYLNNFNHSDYDLHLDKFIINSSYKNEAEIDISIKENDKWKLLKTVKISELESLNFSDVEKELLSKGQKTDSQELALLKKNDVNNYSENLPQEFKDGKVNTIGDFNNCKLRIEKAMLELELQKNELNNQIKEMEKWMRSKFRVLCAYETYLGTKEEVFELIGKGKTSDEPIHLYQAVRFMDEEYGIVNLEHLSETTWVKQDDFDYKDIEKFDEWIAKNFKMFIPSERGIVMWRIKRRNKEYNDAWENMVCNGYNANCYFLIRNGERLYRIFSNVSCKENTMFPTEEQSIQAGKKWYEEKGFDRETFNENTLPWKYILVAIQGILDRTNILGKDCQFKTNLLTGFFDESQIVLVRDMERTNLIGDNTMPKFYDYLKENRKKTKIGDRIIITDLFGSKSCYSGNTNDWDFIYKHHFDWRRKWVGIPRRNLVYEVKDYDEDWGYKILFFEERWWGDDSKKKRTAMWLDENEIFNLSQASEKDIQYYLNDRREREHYLDVIPTMKLAYKYFKTKAYEREDYFRKHFQEM